MMPDPGTMFGGAAASLSLLDNLIKLIRNAQRDETPFTVADVIQKLPVEAFGLARIFESQIDSLELAFRDHNINLERTIEQLEEDYDYWHFRKYRLIRSFEPRVRGLTQAI